jgi:hypothetical protein
MWVLNFLSDFVIHLLLVIGVIGTITGFVLGFIPFVGKYKLPIQIISILVLSVSLWLQGGLANEQKYRLEHERLKASISKKEAQSIVLNQQLSQVLAERDAAIAARGQGIVQTVIEYVKGDPVTIVKRINLSEEERAKLQKKIEELQEAERTCRIPELLIEQVNLSATYPPRENQ